MTSHTLLERPRAPIHPPRRKHPEILRRISLPGARNDRLFFAQVREDPLLEIEALGPLSDARVIVVTSGGCTALSLLAAGARQVTAVDLNSTQNHLVELKVAALQSLTLPEIMSFFGVAGGSAARRSRTYRILRPQLSQRAADYWDSHQKPLGRGALACGVSELFISAVVKAVKLFVHGSPAIERLLSLESLEQQREFFDREWNTRRWRWLFPLLINRWTFNRAFDPEFFREVENPSFAAHFQRLLEHALCDIPVRTNYFLHQMLTGAYPARVRGGVPPYLEQTGSEILRTRLDALELVDAGYAEHLATLEESSVDAMAISNICEWLDPGSIDNLFEQIVRVAKPGARFCFRNFVGHTEVPARFRQNVIEDVDAGRRAIFRDRSCLQSRIAICRIVK
jgi:S-adenosylmethionine:diacylglycerol 3-amino-3-carboxypropyl transferase